MRLYSRKRPCLPHGCGCDLVTERNALQSIVLPQLDIDVPHRLMLKLGDSMAARLGYCQLLLLVNDHVALAVTCARHLPVVCAAFI